MILQDEVAATAAGQPKDNFGAFVQAQHRAGLRGRALADAIHAEQARRGMGRGHGQGKGKHDEDDRDDDQAHGGRSDKPDAAQPAAPRSRGRPDSAGAGHGRSQGRKP